MDEIEQIESVVLDPELAQIIVFCDHCGYTEDISKFTLTPMREGIVPKVYWTCPNCDEQIEGV